MLLIKMSLTSFMALGVSALAISSTSLLEAAVVSTTTLSTSGSVVSGSVVCPTCVVETHTTDVSLPIASGTEYLPDGNITRIDDGGWATFYDDFYCHAGGGEAVSLTNPGCLTEYGRHSVGFKAGELIIPTSLIFSPGNDCNCQNTCLTVEVNSCLSLIGQVDADSFRFIKGGCPDNQCNPT